LRQHRRERIGPVDSRAGADVLPLEQEAHEVARLDRLDLAAQALQRVAVDARQQMPLTPLVVPIGHGLRREAALQHVALAL